MLKIGLFTFGGGWSIVAQIQKEFVEIRGWLTKEELLDIVTIARSFPDVAHTKNREEKGQAGDHQAGPVPDGGLPKVDGGGTAG